MKKTKIVYLGIVAVFIFGLVVGIGAYRTAPTFAEESKNTEKTNPVGEFLSKVASILGVEESELTDAMEQAKTEMIVEKLADVKVELDAKVASGDITQEQANERLEGLTKRIEMMGKKAEIFREKDGTPFGGFKKHGGKHGGKYWRKHDGNSKGLDLEDIKSRIQAAVEKGDITQEQADQKFQSLLEKSKHNKRDWNKPSEDEIRAQIKTAVEEGTLTQEEVDEKLQELDEKLQELTTQ